MTEKSWGYRIPKVCMCIHTTRFCAGTPVPFRYSVWTWLWSLLKFQRKLSPDVREYGFRNPRNTSLMRTAESGTLFSWGMQNPGLWTPEYSSRTPDSNYDWNPKSKFHRQRIRIPVPAIRNPRYGIQNPRLSWIPLYGAKITMHFMLKQEANKLDACQTTQKWHLGTLFFSSALFTFFETYSN